MLRHSSADGSALRVGAEPGLQYTLGLLKISRKVINPGQSDRQTFIGRSCCGRLFEHGDRLRETPCLFVQLRRYEVVNVVLGIARGEGARFGHRCIDTNYLSFDPDQVGLQG